MSAAPVSAAPHGRHAEGDSCTVGHRRQRRQQTFVDIRQRRSARTAAYKVALEAAALFAGVVELVIAVGELARSEVGLEAFGDRHFAAPEPRQCTLRGRVVVHHQQP